MARALRVRTRWERVGGTRPELHGAPAAVRRDPAWRRVSSAALGRDAFLVLDLHEIVAGKIVALFDRGAARDLFDVRRILAIEGLDRGRIKAAVLRARRVQPAGLAGAYRRTPSDAIHASFAAISPTCLPPRSVPRCGRCRRVGLHSPVELCKEGLRVPIRVVGETSGAFSMESSTVAR